MSNLHEQIDRIGRYSPRKKVLIAFICALFIALYSGGLLWFGKVYGEIKMAERCSKVLCKEK